LAQIGQEREPLRVVVGKDPRRPPEQVCRSDHVAAAERAPPGLTEVGGRPSPERTRILVERAELVQGLVRALEVVAEDLAVLEPPLPLPVDALRPVDEPLVEARPRPLEQPLVGRVADEVVLEAIRALLQVAGQATDEMLLHET